MSTETGSSLGTFRTCPKKYEFQYEKRLSPRGYNSSMWLGTFVHAFRAIWHSQSLAEDQHLKFRDEANQLYEEAAKLYPAYLEQVQADWQLANRMALRWFSYWSEDPSEMGESKLEWIDAEKEWIYPVGRDDHAGKRDGYLRHKDYNKHFLYELKTASSKDKESYLSVLNLDYQINSNLTAIAMDNRPWAGVLYDIIWKPTLIRRTDRKTMPNETLAEFHERVMQEMETNPGKYFQRVLVTRSNAQLAEYDSELRAQFQVLHNTEIRYRNPSACRSYNKLCPYHQACMDPASVDLESAFIKRETKHPELHHLGNN